MTCRGYRCQLLLLRRLHPPDTKSRKKLVFNAKLGLVQLLSGMTQRPHLGKFDLQRDQALALAVVLAVFLGL